MELHLTRTRRQIIGVLGVISAGLVLMCAVASPAKAVTTGYQQFCWGVNLPGPGNPCDSLSTAGMAGYATEVSGSSPDRSVCVRAWYTGSEMCSGGPNQGVYNGTPNGLVVTPVAIRPNASAWTKVYGGVYFCYTPGC